jgi:hypothetical protein
LDAGGDTTVGTVTVSVLGSAGSNIIAATHDPSPDRFTITFAGLPGATYQLEVSADLATWTAVSAGTVVVPASGTSVGVGVFLDNAPPGPLAFYRTVHVSGP